MSDGGMLRPEVEGVASKGRPVLDSRGFIKKHELKVGSASNLIGFESDYAFFTPAILYLHGGFRDAPLADLCHIYDLDIHFYYRKFGRPIFRGLEAQNGDPDWNFALWAVAREYWQLVSDWLVSLTLTYSDTGDVAGIGEQYLTVVDPLAVERTVLWSPNIPKLNVAAFGINGNKFRAYLRAGESMLVDPPALTFSPPDESMLVFAEALYGGQNPVDAKAHYLKKFEEKTP